MTTSDAIYDQALQDLTGTPGSASDDQARDLADLARTAMRGIDRRSRLPEGTDPAALELLRRARYAGTLGGPWYLNRRGLTALADLT
ncbi:hypothetical protein [Kitasatospora sp. NPDC088783]|uniref:hypothetical protein n=1 Tax=Kitasatospora sp. NPDC088783 TaxID=3364077 RepID=UPI0037F84367